MEQIIPGFQFRALLRRELKQRVEKNDRYSLRAFSNDLGVSASGLSMMMSGKTPVTLQFIEKTGERLKLDHQQISEHQISLLQEKTKIKAQAKNFEIIPKDKVALVKEWYHYAILNLLRTKDFRQQEAWLARRLGLSLGEVQTAVEDLFKAGLLANQNGRWVDQTNLFTSHTNNKSFCENAKNHQKQLFSKAHDAIDEISFENRNHTGCTVAISMDELEEIKNYITKFRKEFIKSFDRKSSADEVYHLSLGLFPMTRLKKEKK